MTMCDYFSARDDATALLVLDEPGGPDPSVLDVVPLKGVDPVVVLAQLEAVLTGCSYAEAATRPRSGELVSSPEDEGAFVIAVSDSLQRALAQADPAALRAAAAPWALTDELRAAGVTPETAAETVTLLSGLASRATGSGDRLYCWWAV
ncbi:hypothetical protein ABT160_20450 [Streptomyces sp. NPDC001941]|uniref:hypothetical protein n=1 Tax=Streptomyces sp. NPDC001941 TaxID=3154659 RepID=UPI00331E7AED